MLEKENAALKGGNNVLEDWKKEMSEEKQRLLSEVATLKHQKKHQAQEIQDIKNQMAIQIKVSKDEQKTKQVNQI